jgi:hypothetical protein
MLVGCTDVVHVRLKHEDDPAIEQECEQVIQNMRSFEAVLVQEQTELKQSLQKCINIPERSAPKDLVELESMLASSIVFPDVDAGYTWTIWVEGSDVPCNQAGLAPLLCGKEEKQAIPSPDGDITVNIKCVAPPNVWLAEEIFICRSKSDPFQ